MTACRSLLVLLVLPLLATIALAQDQNTNSEPDVETSPPPDDTPLTNPPVLDEDAPLAEDLPDQGLQLDQVEADEIQLPSRVAVLPALVTIDGAHRTDLGTFVSDTIIAALVQSKSRVVFDASSRTLEADHTSQSRLTPSQPLAIGKALEVDQVYVPVVVGQGSLFTLSARIVSVPSGRIERVHQHHARGGVNALYEVVDQFTAELVPGQATHSSPGPRYTKIKAWMSENPYASIVNYSPDRAAAAARRENDLQSTAVEVEPVSPIPLPPAERRPDQRERIGSVLQVVEKWNFVVIRFYSGKEFAIGDELFFLADEFADRFREFRVTKLEGKNIIAEITNKHDATFIRSGEAVFRWTDPVPEPTQVVTTPKPATDL